MKRELKPEHEPRPLHGWDDEKVYFWDEERKKEWCVTDEEELYRQLVEICRAYFRKKISKGDKVK